MSLKKISLLQNDQTAMAQLKEIGFNNCSNYETLFKKAASKSKKELINAMLKFNLVDYLYVITLFQKAVKRGDLITIQSLLKFNSRKFSYCSFMSSSK